MDTFEDDEELAHEHDGMDDLDDQQTEIDEDNDEHEGRTVTPEMVVAKLQAEIDNSTLVVQGVGAADSAQGTPATQAAILRRENKLRAEVKAYLESEGIYTPERLEKLVAKRAKDLVVKGKQRSCPFGLPATHAAMIYFFSERDDRQIMGDCLKSVRNDGGTLGPAGAYRKLLIAHGVDPDTAMRAAQAIADKVGHRIIQIRWSVASTFNELERRAGRAEFFKVQD